MQWHNRALPALSLAALLLFAACEGPDPAVNRPTSGRLILIVDEMYGPLFTALADSFMAITPNSRIEVRTAPARMAVEQLLNVHIQNARGSDTLPSVAAILGRRMLPDELEAIDKARLELHEFLIGYDGIALLVPTASPLLSTDLQWARRAMMTPTARISQLDTNAGDQPLRFLVPDQNSSTFMVLRRNVLGDSNISAPARYFQTGDSVVAAVVAGEGVGVIGWYPARRDSLRVRPLRLGYADSAGLYTAPVGINAATLVTKTYPLKQPLMGYTLSLTNSLATGFLAWVAKSGPPQRYLTEQGLQSENIKYRLVMPEQGQ
jgi:ABC-type phosphate transport system substrate-binding protein